MHRIHSMPLAVRRVFPLATALLICLIVAVGFGPTLDARLLRPLTPRPWLLYVHVALMTAWVLLFLAQTGLTYTRRISAHRRLGLMGVVLGVLIPVVGIATAIVMTRLQAAEGGGDGASFLVVSFFDLLAFAVTFGLAIRWRTRPAYHGRLMIMASCCLVVPGLARLPEWLVPSNSWYVAVDTMIVAAAIWDRVVIGRVHPVYYYGLPALAIGQAATMWVYLSNAPIWIGFAQALLR
ncbi:hypothetical protein MOK15_14185 [Sphingobium sp. BYY-5]|uniref:hypothetical protein n=1 Tax=Sphingobium sp. BYY-5 TaxID=2926400 RepID=UPI001FA6CD82|nr:hypothetical protein [Sphingobium sp. BYY-5]MCI4591235.1 hypothetical protein [Sphingobium sp. BYY-5]